MKRRDFIIKGSLFAFAVSTINYSCLTSKETSEITTGDNCDPTTKDILGPFFRAGAPLRNNVRAKNDQRNLLTIKGQLMLNDCKTPIKNTVIDFWQANNKGEYDNETSDFNYRAKVKTDENGNYEYKTIIPGKYLNGNQFRPSHIHIRVNGENTHELISQIYFQGDEHIENDPWASHPSAKQRLLPQSDLSNTEKLVTFDLILKQLT